MACSSVLYLHRKQKVVTSERKVGEDDAELALAEVAHVFATLQTRRR